MSANRMTWRRQRASKGKCKLSASAHGSSVRHCCSPKRRVRNSPALSRKRVDASSRLNRRMRWRSTPMRKLRIFIADDHVLLQEGLTMLINAQPDMEVVGHASDGRALVQQTQ